MCIIWVGCRSRQKGGITKSAGEDVIDAEADGPADGESYRE